MTFPFVIHVGHSSILFHMVMDFVSMTIGSLMYWHSSKDDGISSEKRIHLLIGAGLGALIGSRLLGALEDPYLFLHPPVLLYYYASKTIIGGIAGGILGMEAAKLIIGHRKSTGDKITIPLLVAILVGRFGCLFTGVSDGTVGNPCNFFWCFNQGDGIARHPTTLYEIIFLIGLLIFLLYLRNKKLGEGIIFRTFVICYFIFRFLIEFIKPVHPIVWGLSVIQIVCVLYSIWYAYDIGRIWKKNDQRRIT